MKNLIFKIIGFGILIGSLLVGWGWKQMNIIMSAKPELPEEGLVVEISKGDNFYQVADNLSQLSIGPTRVWHRFIAWRYPELTAVKTAEYLLEPGLSYQDILQRFTTGKGMQYSIQFLEGWRFKEALAEISRHPRLTQDIELDVSTVRELLAIDQVNPEGWLFPDTYQFPRATNASQLLKLMHQRMQDTLTQAWDSRSLDNELGSPFELLIMASLIEKEAAIAAERPIISGVFHRRLALNMRLQTDPTVIYAMGDEYDGDIRRRDLMRQSPYNTYRVFGLPPTPIALPSRASLMAAAQPASGTELYFVARGDGSHVFSDTLEEHNKAVRKYQLGK